MEENKIRLELDIIEAGAVYKAIYYSAMINSADKNMLKDINKTLALKISAYNENSHPVNSNFNVK